MPYGSRIERDTTVAAQKLYDRLADVAAWDQLASLAAMFAHQARNCRPRGEREPTYSRRNGVAGRDERRNTAVAALVAILMDQGGVFVEQSQ
jgi:hypothetical protein